MTDTVLKTPLTIIQELCRRINEPVPAAWIGTTDPQYLQIFQLFYDVVEELRQAATWAQQKRTVSFTTTSGRARYLLPQNYFTSLPLTIWNTSESNRLIGPVSDAEFTERTKGNASSSTNFIYRIHGVDTNLLSGSATTGSFGEMELHPTPSSAVDVYYEYVWRNTLVPALYELSTAYTAGDYCYANGNIYKCATNITSSDTYPTGTGTGIVDDDGTWDHTYEAYETVKADTDLCIFDPDLVKLGMRAKYLEENGGEWQAADAEFKGRISASATRHKGPFVSSFSRRHHRPNLRFPYKSWSF